MDSMDSPNNTDRAVTFILQPAYEDDSLIIVDKPQGLAVTPGKNPSLCEQVFAVYPDLGGVHGYKPGEGGLLNRLDNETGGLVMFAKTGRAFEYYAALLKAEQVIKEYTAVVSRKPSAAGGTIAVPIAHHHKSKKRMVAVAAEGAAAGAGRAAAEGAAAGAGRVAAADSAAAGSAAAGKTVRSVGYRGKPRAALTRWKLAGRQAHGYVLEVTITRGVRHQIRVHLAHAGMPIVGDTLYNRSGPESAFHLLYAHGLRFTAFSGENITVRVRVPFLLR
jgi:23S rRNA pseudouridine1911/1915/1917 synthase